MGNIPIIPAFLTPSLETFTQGSMVIEVDNKHIMPGEILTGTVTLNLDDMFPSKRLMIELAGHEKVKFG
jgi:hypothetical protein